MAEKIPEIRNHYRLDLLVRDSATRALVVAATDRLVMRLASEEPDFFPRFEAAISSGDHLKIQSALAEAGDVTARVFSKMPEAGSLAAVVSDERRMKELRTELAKHLPERPEYQQALDETLERFASEPQPASSRELPPGDASPNACGPGSAICVFALGVYVVVAVHVGVVYVAGVWMVAGKYLAVSKLTNGGPEVSSVMADRLVNSVALTYAR